MLNSKTTSRRRKRDGLQLHNNWAVIFGGAKSAHPIGFAINRPNGLGCYLLLRFHSPVRLRVKTGIIDAEPGDMIIYDPSFPQYYEGRGVGLCDDWLHFEGADTASLLKRLKIPLNRLFSPGDARFVGALVEGIHQEIINKEIGWKDICSLRMQELLLLLARRRAMDKLCPMSGIERERYETIRNVKVQIQNNFAKDWTIQQMAKLAGVSPSRFSALYAKFFGDSPIESLIKTRLEHAKYLLLGTNCAIKDVAEQCGFSNAHYFSRLFSKRTGGAPRDFYQARISDQSGKRRRRNEG